MSRKSVRSASRPPAKEELSCSGLVSRPATVFAIGSRQAAMRHQEAARMAMREFRVCRRSFDQMSQ